MSRDRFEGLLARLTRGRSLGRTEQTRVLFLVATVLVALFTSSISIATQVTAGSLSQTPVLLGFDAALIACLLLLRTRAPLALIHGVALIVTTTFLVLMSVTTVELVYAQLYWFAIIPLTATMLLGRRAALFGALLAVASVGLVVLAHELGWTRGLHATTEPLESLVDVVTFLGAITLLASVFELLRLRAVERAEQAGAARTQFLAHVSHELRTPMNGVIGMADLLATTTLDEEQREQVEILRRSGEAMIAIIDDLLDLTKIESGHLVLDQLDFDPAEVLGDVATLFQGRARAKGLQLDAEPDESLPPALRGDPLRLKQILQNLVSNAVKFTERGRVRVRLSWRGSVLTGLVEDEGIGISPEAQQTIFDAFVQADVSTTRRFGGTGLGLTIVRRLCRAMGGDIRVDSRPGAGTRFIFELHLPAGRRLEPRPVEAPRPQSARGGRVLIAEDNAVNQLVVRRLCERLGLTVDVVSDGHSAVERLTAERYALVLMDCHMPGLDGLEATRRIRALTGPSARTPIVAVTASALPEDLAACRAAGMDAALSKPLTSAALQATLERLGVLA